MADKTEGQPAKPAETKQTGGYGKRPLWQWIVIYIVVGGLLYFAVYYFFFHKTSYNYGGTPTNNSSQNYNY